MKYSIEKEKGRKQKEKYLAQHADEIKKQREYSIFDQKIDLLEEYLYIQPQFANAIRISATTDKNIDKLIEMIQKELEHDFISICLHVPYNEQEIVELLKDNGYAKIIDYQEFQIEVQGKIPKRLFSRVEKYQ